MPQAVEITKMSSTVQIVKTPDTLHGKPRLEGTRVGVLEVGELVRQRQWSISEVADRWVSMMHKSVLRPSTTMSIRS